MLAQLSPDIGSNVQVLVLSGGWQGRAGTCRHRNSGADLNLVGVTSCKVHGVMPAVYVFPISHFVEGKIQTIGLNGLNVRSLFLSIFFRFVLGSRRAWASQSDRDY